MFYTSQEPRSGFPGEYEVHATIDRCFGKRFHYAEFVFMPLAIANAEQIGERKSIRVAFWLIGIVHAAPNIDHLLRRDLDHWTICLRVNSDTVKILAARWQARLTKVA